MPEGVGLGILYIGVSWLKGDCVSVFVRKNEDLPKHGRSSNEDLSVLLYIHKPF